MLLCVVFVLCEACKCVLSPWSVCYSHTYIRTHVYGLSISLTCHSLTNRETCP